MEPTVMSSILSRRTLVVSALMAMTLAVVGCDNAPDRSVHVPPAYEGDYKNAKGVVVLSIKDGQISFTNPTTRAKVQVPFSDLGDKLMVESSSGTFTLTFQAPDTMTGLPASIAGGSEPLKKST
jgi:hypothetical protein